MIIEIMKRINFRQPKFILPMAIFIPLLFEGWLVIHLFHIEKSSVENQSALLMPKPTGRFGKIVDLNDTIVADSFRYNSKYSEIEKLSLEQRHIADSLKKAEDKTAPAKESEWKEWNSLDGAASNMMTGIKKTLSFCAEVIDKGAVPVYVKDLTPTDSIN